MTGTAKFLFTRVLYFNFLKGYIIYELNGGVRFPILGCSSTELHLGIILFIQLMLHGH